MKTLKKTLTFLLFTIIILSPVSIYALDRDDYVDSVMDIFRMHTKLIEDMSSENRFKYSDNLVRHAVAIEMTFGLLGPMEWHAAEAASIVTEKKGTDADLNEEMFEDLAKASRKSLKNLTRAAHDSMERHDHEGIIKAIKEMKHSCENCHSHLPKSTAPDLFGPLQRVK